MAKQKHQWFATLSPYRSPTLGAIGMLVTVFGTFIVSTEILRFGDLKSWLVSGIFGIIVGLAYNAVAETHRLKRLNFFDFLDIDLMPWR